MPLSRNHLSRRCLPEPLVCRCPWAGIGWSVPPFKLNEKEGSKIIKEKETIKQKNEDYKKEENETIIQKEKQPQRKKEWKSWSSQEKLMFYELIANGGNYSSLQKLFKTMNDVRIKNIILNIKYFLNIKY